MVSKQTRAILKGEYGRTVRPFNKSVQKKVIGSGDIVTCRPADLLPPEFHEKKSELGGMASDEEVLAYILFPQSAETFYNHR